MGSQAAAVIDTGSRIVVYHIPLLYKPVNHTCLVVVSYIVVMQ